MYCLYTWKREANSITISNDKDNDNFHRTVVSNLDRTLVERSSTLDGKCICTDFWMQIWVFRWIVLTTLITTCFVTSWLARSCRKLMNRKFILDLKEIDLIYEFIIHYDVCPIDCSYRYRLSIVMLKLKFFINHSTTFIALLYFKLRRMSVW